MNLLIKWLILWDHSLWCSLMVLMQDQTLQGCLPQSQLCCCSLSVWPWLLWVLAIRESTHLLQLSAPCPRVAAPGARGVAAGMAHSCLPRARGLQVPPRHHAAPSTAKGSGHRYCLSCSWSGESPTVILILPF